MVPDGWMETCLKNIILGRVKNGFSPVATDQETGFWVLSLGALGDDGINISEVKPVNPTNKVIKSLLSPGDFLVSRSNTPDKVGRSILFNGEIENCSYPDLIIRFRIDNNKADPFFIEQKLRSTTIRAYFKNYAAGSSSTMVKINKGILEKTPLLMPSLKEQQKISQILSTWDKAITTSEQLLANSQQQKKALMQQLLTGKKRFAGFSGEWETVNLSALCNITTGKKDVNEGNSVGEFPFFTCAKERTYCDFFSFDCEALLIAGNGVLGTTHYYIGKFEAYQRTYVLKDFKNVFVQYLYQYILHYLSKDIDREKQHGAMPYIKVGLLTRFLVRLPSIDEQKQIAKTLYTVNQEIEVMQQKLNFLKQEKKALMQQLLTGKKRVQIN